MAYICVVGIDDTGLSDLLSRRGFGGGLWGKPLHKLFPHYFFKTKVVCKLLV